MSAVFHNPIVRLAKRRNNHAIKKFNVIRSVQRIAGNLYLKKVVVVVAAVATKKLKLPKKSISNEFKFCFTNNTHDDRYYFKSNNKI